MPYADISRQPITLWEHREAVQRLRQEGRRSVDEHAIFASIAEQRRVLLEAQSRSKAARRAVARIDRAERPSSSVNPAQEGQGRDDQDGEARVPMPPGRRDERRGVLVMAAEFEHLPLDVRPIAGLDADCADSPYPC